MTVAPYGYCFSKCFPSLASKAWWYDGKQVCFDVESRLIGKSHVNMKYKQKWNEVAVWSFESIHVWQLVHDQKQFGNTFTESKQNEEYNKMIINNNDDIANTVSTHGLATVILPIVIVQLSIGRKLQRPKFEGWLPILFGSMTLLISNVL